MKTPVQSVIGLDLDNTIVCYEQLLAKLSSGYGWAPDAVGKRAIRDWIRSSEEGDAGWQRLQGEIYGPRMLDAQLMPGVLEFLKACQLHNIRVVIISHKSEYAVVDPSRTPLRHAAMNWMRINGFFENGLIAHQDVFFADTKDQKVNLIRELGVSIFVDDLEEILTHPTFPEGTRRFLFSPDGIANCGPYSVIREFSEIQKELFGG